MALPPFVASKITIGGSHAQSEASKCPGCGADKAATMTVSTLDGPRCSACGLPTSFSPKRFLIDDIAALDPEGDEIVQRETMFKLSGKQEVVGVTTFDLVLKPLCAPPPGARVKVVAVLHHQFADQVGREYTVLRLGPPHESGDYVALHTVEPEWRYGGLYCRLDMVPWRRRNKRPKPPPPALISRGRPLEVDAESRWAFG